MKTSYSTVILAFGNHAAIEIPEENLKEIGGNKRAALKITIGHYTYQSTATGMNGKCLVVFPTRDRNASGVSSGDKVIVTLELDDEYRKVAIPSDLNSALKVSKLDKVFHSLTYSKRKEFARLVGDAKAEETKVRRIAAIIKQLEPYA